MAKYCKLLLVLKDVVIFTFSVISDIFTNDQFLPVIRPPLYLLNGLM